MLITLHDAKTLALRFPYSALRVAQVKTLPTRVFDRDAGAWLVPLADFARVLALGGDDASVDVEVWEAAYPTRARRLAGALTFCQALAALGVTICLQDGRLVAQGAHVSPLVQAEVEQRGALIRRLLADGWEFVGMQDGGDGGVGVGNITGAADGAAQDATTSAVPATPTATVPDDAKLELLLAGIKNAAKRAAADQERRAAWRRRAQSGGRQKAQQGDLGL